MRRKGKPGALWHPGRAPPAGGLTIVAGPMTPSIASPRASFPLAFAIAALAFSSPDAEYAMRWEPADGGPQSASEVAYLLGLGTPTVTTFEVRYYDAPPPANAPDSARTIVRERARENGASDLIVKYRRAAPLHGTWSCPLGTAAKRAAQVDVGFGPGDSVERVYSYTCELVADSFPPSLHATPRACTIAVTRTTANGVKIEAWQLPNGRTLLEISRVAKDSRKELDKFRAMVDKLVVAGARPTLASKTRLAGQCG